MNVYCEDQVPWPPERAATDSRKNGPFKTNMNDACERVVSAVDAFTKRGGEWRTESLWIFADGKVGAKGRFLANQPGLRDPRVAVRFDLDGTEYNICADRYFEPWQNLAGIAAYVEAIRAQERNGIFTVSEMMSSFAALPAPEKRRTCWDVLGIPPGSPPEQVDTAYRALAKSLHPDAGGSGDAMAELNRAREEAKR